MSNYNGTSRGVIYDCNIYAKTKSSIPVARDVSISGTRFRSTALARKLVALQGLDYRLQRTPVVSAVVRGNDHLYTVTYGGSSVEVIMPKA